MYKEIIKPSIILFLVCAVITGALAYVAAVTKPIIAENDKLAKQEAMAEVLPEAKSFSDPVSFEALEKEGFPVTGTIKNIYVAPDCGFVVEVTTKGYGGEVNMMVGIGNDKTVKGVKLTSHNETPGLGAKAANPEFVEQYLGPIPEGGFVVVKGASKSDSEIEAVSGATISSRAVTNGVTEAVNLIDYIIDEDAAATLNTLAGGN